MIRRCPYCGSGWTEGRLVEQPHLLRPCLSCGWQVSQRIQLVQELDAILPRAIANPTVDGAKAVGALMAQLKAVIGL